MEYRSLQTLFTGMLLIVTILAVIRLDWMLAFAELLGLSMVYVPLKRDGALVHPVFLRAGTMLSVVMLVLILVDCSCVMDGMDWGGVPWAWSLQLMVIPLVTFNDGMMFAAILDRYTESCISRRWMIVLAMVFTFAFSAVYCFMVGYGLWVTGQPFTNEDIETFGRLTNPVLMAAPGYACIVGVICALIVRKAIKRVDKADFLKGVR